MPGIAYNANARYAFDFTLLLYVGNISSCFGILP